MNLKNQRLLVFRAKERTLGRIPRYRYNILVDHEKVDQYFSDVILTADQKQIKANEYAFINNISPIGVKLKNVEFMKNKPRTIIFLGKVS